MTTTRNSSTFSWRLVLLTLTLLALVVGIWASLYVARMSPAGAGTLAARFGAPDAEGRRPILALETDSPLLRAAAAAGNLVRFDRNILMNLGTDEQVGLTLYAGERRVHLVVRPIPDKDVGAHPIAAVLYAACNLAGAFAALTIALLIGLRRADSAPMRVFALLLFGGIGVDNIGLSMPTSALADAIFPFLRSFGFASGYLLFTLFALLYPEDRPFWRHRLVRRAFHVYLLGFVAFECTVIAAMFGYAPTLLQLPRTVAVMSDITHALALGSVLASLVPLTMSWARSSGVERQRLGWIGACMGSIYTCWFMENVNLALGSPVSVLVLEAATAVVCMLALSGFAYALLRHRLFDFGFAVNRALVVTIISSLLLVVFSITEWGVDKLLHFEGREKNVVFDALVALGVILSFHRIQHWVSHQVDHTFFHHWYQAAENFRRFLDMTAHVSDPEALRGKFIDAVTQFAGTTGVAIYARSAAGDFVVTRSTLAGAPAAIGANQDLVIELSHTHQMADLAGSAALPCELAFPMTVRGRLEGMVLLGERQGGKRYRPDQLVLLGAGVHQLGMDLESLRVTELEGAMASLRRNMELVEREAATLRHVVETRTAAAAS